MQHFLSRAMVGAAFCLILVACKQSGLECDAGQVEVDGACAQLCGSDLECSKGQICENEVCSKGDPRGIPMITSIDSDGPVDGTPDHTQHLAGSNVIIRGQNLDGAAVNLITERAGELALNVCARSDTEIVAELPGGMQTGSYLLQVANNSGSCESQMPVLQGQPGPQGPQGPAGIPCSGTNACVSSSDIKPGAIAAEHLAEDLNIGPLAKFQLSAECSNNGASCSLFASKHNVESVKFDSNGKKYVVTLSKAVPDGYLVECMNFGTRQGVNYEITAQSSLGFTVRLMWSGSSHSNQPFGCMVW